MQLLRSALLRRNKNEQGSTLILALVLIIIIAVAGAAVLKQQSSSFNVQRVYQGVRDTELSVDGVADQTIHTIRLDSSAGVDATGVSGATNTCNNPNAWQPTPNAPPGYTVLCEPVTGSGKGKDGAPDPPGAAIVTLGGELQVAADDGTVTADPGGWFPNGYYNPFCDNWHAFQAGSSGRCEAGIYVGRATGGTDSATGGLVIGTSNALNPDPRGEVLSNGSIIAGYNGATPRELDVEGGIWARAACGAYHDAQPFLAGQVIAGYNGSGGTKDCQNDCAHSGGPYSAQFCFSYSGADTGPLDETSASNTLMPDPDYVHEPLDFGTVVSGAFVSNVCTALPAANCVPRVDNQGGAALPLSPAGLCTATGGVAVMPARQVGTELGKQVYAAIYDNAHDLTTFMQDNQCKDTFFWFRPGVYYFDFTDKSASTAWEAPKGCIPSSASCVADQILGGTPDPAIWNPCVTTAGDWSSAASVGNIGQSGQATCQQPDKIMTPDKDDYGNKLVWASADNVDYVDQQLATTAVGPGNAAEWLQQYGFESPVPESGSRTETLLTKVQVQLGYSLPSAANLYKDAHNNTQGAYLDINIPPGDCYVHLPPDGGTDNDALTAPSLTGPQEPTGANEVIDLTDGCNVGTGNIVDRNSGMPTSGSCAALPLNLTNDPNCLRLHPEWIDQMKVTFNVAASGLATAANMAQVGVDGIQLKVGWKGRPAPPFPNGCHISDPGVQWIFGGTSRIRWGEDSQQQVIAELCASKQNLFPQPAGWSSPTYPDSTQAASQSGLDHLLNSSIPVVNDANYQTGNGNPYGIAIYGLSSDNVARTKLLTTDPSTNNWLTPTDVLATPTYDVTNSSSNPLWRNTATTGAPTWADVSTKGDSKQATVTWPVNSNNPAELVYDMPDLTTLGVPAASTITNVNVEVQHREGDLDSSGTFVPGGLAPGGTPDISTDDLSLKPGNTSLGANGMQAQTWDSVTQSYVALNNSLPPCTYSNPTLPSGSPVTTSCTFKWGDPGATYVTNPPSTAYADPPWAWQRDLTDRLSTVEGLSNAQIDWKVSVHGNSTCGAITATTCDHAAYVDHIRVSVSYRPFGQQLRPLRGCVTTRTAWVPYQMVGTDLTALSGLGASVNAVSHDWLDADWAPNATAGGTPTNVGDAAFGNVSDGGSLGNGGIQTQDDTTDCAFIDIANTPGRVKFHVQGSIYAPSAAISLSGNANDAQWATQNITSRQLTAIRQKNAKGIPGVGDEPIPRAPRDVKILVCAGTPTTPASGCDPGTTRLSTLVEITDLPDFPGYLEKNLSWIRNPS